MSSVLKKADKLNIRGVTVPLKNMGNIGSSKTTTNKPY